MHVFAGCRTSSITTPRTVMRTYLRPGDASMGYRWLSVRGPQKQSWSEWVRREIKILAGLAVATVGVVYAYRRYNANVAKSSLSQAAVAKADGKHLKAAQQLQEALTTLEENNSNLQLNEEIYLAACDCGEQYILADRPKSAKIAFSRALQVCDRWEEQKKQDVIRTQRPLSVGEEIEANWQSGGVYYRGKIVEIKNNPGKNVDTTCHIAYTDGDKEENVPLTHIRQQRSETTEDMHMRLRLIVVLDRLAQLSHDEGDPALAEELYFRSVAVVQSGKIDAEIAAAACGVLNNAAALLIEGTPPRIVEARAMLQFAGKLANSPEGRQLVSLEQASELKMKFDQIS